MRLIPRTYVFARGLKLSGPSLGVLRTAARNNHQRINARINAGWSGKLRKRRGRDTCTTNPLSQGTACAPLPRRKREDVRERPSNDTDVSAETRAVRGGIVRAVNVALRSLSQRHLEHGLNQVRLNAMMFSILRARASSVKRPQGDEFQAV